MNSSYKATVITPFHNTDMSLFQSTYDSLINQTIGFENIEWIVVLHNCKKEYIDAVNNLIGKHENVFIKELYNEARSASSPRNHGFKFATSRYVQFLDSDDSLSLNTIETCLDKMQKHNPQLIVFRMAYARQNDSVLSVMTDLTLWNPLKEEIILNGDEINCRELYTSINLCTHKVFFDVEFLRENELTFDEEVIMGEDAFFTLQSYSKAQKIVVLPQFIGHCYYLNSNSAVQSLSKKREDVLRIAYGHKKIFDFLIDNKVYFNHIILTFLEGCMVYAYHSPDLTLDDWKELQEIFKPYMELISPPPVNKFFSKEESELIYSFVRHNVLDPKTDENSDRINYFNNEGILLDIIRKNADTDIGRYYGFDTVSSIADYVKKVPLYDHPAYDRLVRLQTTVGEKNVLTCDKISTYAYDFGQDNIMQTVPMTQLTYEELGQDFVRDIKDQVTFLMIESLPKGRSLNDDAYNDSITGIMVRSGIGNYSLAATDIPGEFTSPFSLIFPRKVMNSDYLNLLFALRNPDVTQIYASNTYVVLSYLDLLFSHYKEICDDIASGTVSVADNDTKVFAYGIHELVIPDKDRADLIRTAIETKDKGDVLKEIWPSLTRIIARKDGVFKLYTRRILAYIKDISLSPGDLITPYGIIGEEAQDGQFCLKDKSGFYEFIPDGQKDDTTCFISDIKPGEVYELIVTNRSGLYRMHTNTYIKPVKTGVEGVYFEESEKELYIDQKLLIHTEDLYSSLADLFGDDLCDYAFCFNESENCLEIFAETLKDPGTDDTALKLDEALLTYEEYKSARNAGLNACKISFIEGETRSLFNDINRYRHNVPLGCFNPYHNLENKTLINMFRAHSI